MNSCCIRYENDAKNALQELLDSHIDLSIRKAFGLAWHRANGSLMPALVFITLAGRRDRFYGP